MKKKLILILIIFISGIQAQEHYIANPHVEFNRADVDGKYVVNYTFMDHKNNLVSITEEFDKQMVDEDIDVFGIPKSMLEPYNSTPEIEKQRTETIKAGLFKVTDNTLEIDYDAFILKYRKYCESIAEWMVSYLGNQQIDTRRDRIELAVKFVQDIPYAIPTDIDPNWNYGGVNPIPSLLITGWGDCDSKAFLFAGIMSYLIDYKDIRFAGEPGHLYTLIANDRNDIVKDGQTTYFNIEGRYFLVAETAGPGRFAFGEAGESEYDSAEIEEIDLGSITPIQYLAKDDVALGSDEGELQNTSKTPLDLDKITSLANQGESIPQEILANKYYYGEDVPKDVSKALFWYKKLADNASKFGYFQVAEILYWGKGGVPRDIESAKFYYSVLAGLGDSISKNRLAEIDANNSASSTSGNNNLVSEDKNSTNNADYYSDEITTTGSKVTPEEAKQIVAEHNRVRADVGVGPVTWSNELASFAQDWADQLVANGCSFEHRPDNKYGENLFMGSKGYTVVNSVQSWESEKKNYTYGPSGTTPQAGVVGHYTQIIWKNTKKIGCGIAECNGMIIVVCNYDPAGNYTGKNPY